MPAKYTIHQFTSMLVIQIESNLTYNVGVYDTQIPKNAFYDSEREYSMEALPSSKFSKFCIERHNNQRSS